MQFRLSFFTVLLLVFCAFCYSCTGDAQEPTAIECLQKQYGQKPCETNEELMARKIKDFQEVQNIQRQPLESDEDYVKRVVAMAQAWTFGKNLPQLPSHLSSRSQPEWDDFFV